MSSSIWGQHSITRTAVWLVLGALVLVGTILISHYHPGHAPLLLSNTAAQESSAGSLANTPRAHDRDPTLHAESGSSGDTTTPAPADTDNIQPKASAIIPEKPADNSTDCKDKMDAAVDDYNAKVKKTKTDLDNSIRVPLVGLNVISRYVSDYNDTVTDLYNTLVSQATDEGCTFPLKSPATLPSTYH